MMATTILREVKFQKRLLWLNGFLPALFLVIDLYNNNLGANPPEAIIRTTGVVAIIFLVLTLAATPIANIFKQHWLIVHKRWLGLWCFYYALLHLISYSVFDKSLDSDAIIEDILMRPFILLGFLGFLFLIPLAITSNNSMIRRMGPLSWKRLHSLVYIIPILVVFHYGLIVKSDYFYPMIFAFIFSVLLFYRMVAHLFKRRVRNS